MTKSPVSRRMNALRLLVSFGIDEDQLPLTPAQQAELESRLETLDHDRSESIIWESLKKELEKRYL